MGDDGKLYKVGNTEMIKKTDVTSFNTVLETIDKLYKQLSNTQKYIESLENQIKELKAENDVLKKNND